MIVLQFTEPEIETLHCGRFYHPSPEVCKRMEVVYLKAMGQSHKEIGLLCRITQPTVREHLTAYQQKGFLGLTINNHYQPESELENFLDSIEKEFEKEPPATIPEAQYRIEQLTGIKRCPTQIRAFLTKHGFKRLKVGYVLGKAATAKKCKNRKPVE